MNRSKHKGKPFSSFTLIVTFVCLSVIGLSVMPLLPIKLSPSRTLPGLTVSFMMPGNSAMIIEKEVTSKLEGMLSRINGIKNIYSTSDNGSGNIRLEMDKHADMETTRFEVSTLIRQLWSQLPDGITYPQISSSKSDETAERPFITYTLNAPATPIVIQHYGEEVIKPLLSQIRGIYKIELSGATPMEWRLEYDNTQLERIGLSVYDINQAIHEYYDSEFMGICQIDSHGDWIRVMISSPDNKTTFIPSNIKLADNNGNLISLDKLVSVKHVEEEPSSYFRINGLNSIYLSITAEETANQLMLASKIHEAINQLQPSLPTGYEIHTSYDATEYINKELDKIYFRTGITLLVLLLFVAIISRNLRYLFMITVSLTVNIAVAMIFYYLFGLEIQLYSLAGITISLNLVIDNTIVMTDHILRKHNLKAFLSILAATLTTIGALSIILFLDERIRLNLQDFAIVMIINLAVSLLVSLFFVPSMIEKTGIRRNAPKHPRLILKRCTVYFTIFYRWLIVKLCHYRVAMYILIILAFGTPVFLIPEKIENPEGKGKWAEWYNKVFDTPTFKQDIKPVVDKTLGGSLRLFVEKVFNGYYFNRDNNEIVLSVDASLPNGYTLEQMNTLIKGMETYLSTFTGIKQFQTSIYDPQNASIKIYFKREHQHGGYPYQVRTNIVNKALTLGGGSWSVYGLPDMNFSNDVREGAGSFNIKMYGYNYDELTNWADEMKTLLLTHRRIKEVTINSEFSTWKDDYSEFILQFDNERMAKESLTPYMLYTALRPLFMKNQLIGSIVYNNQLESLRITSAQSKQYDVWSFMQVPFTINGKSYKLSDLAEIRKSSLPKKIAKENQQYILCLQYEYIGTFEQGKKMLDKDVELMKKRLPMGYTVESKDYDMRWWKKDFSQYTLLLLVIAIIFFISSILFNSLKQPLTIIMIIPISYIGVFLTFYLFGLNFDHGGFASFVLLCGITVNASIYILNEYNTIRRNFPNISPICAYTKAWNTKIIPIFLTVVSTILGFIPFMVGDTKEAFWFPLAAGSIGGLVMSIVGIFFYLPIFTIGKKKIN